MVCEKGNNTEHVDGFPFILEGTGGICALRLN